MEEIATVYARALFEAKSRGFDNCIVRDVAGNVAELANSNVFMAKDGVLFTPIPNGTFLAGITRMRVIGLLRDAGVTVVEKVLRYSDFENADEIFATGNASKVLADGSLDLGFGADREAARSDSAATLRDSRHSQGPCARSRRSPNTGCAFAIRSTIGE